MSKDLREDFSARVDAMQESLRPNVDPLIAAILETIHPSKEYPMETPCRVSADLRALDREQREAELNAPEFTHLEEDFRQIVPKELAPHFEHLYSTYQQINAVLGSYGDDSVRARQALGWLMEDLARMEEEILTLWENA